MISTINTEILRHFSQALFCLLFVISERSQAFAPGGNCISDPFSKIYLSEIKVNNEFLRADSRFQLINKTLDGPANFLSGVNKNLLDLNDSSNTKYYFCQITCSTQEGKSLVEYVTLQDSPEKLEDMHGFLCPHVDIVDKAIVGDLTSPEPEAQPFWFFDTDWSGLRQWMIDNHFKLSSEESENFYIQFLGTISALGQGLQYSAFPEMREAGLKLEEISKNLDSGKSMLNQELTELIQNHWNIPKLNATDNSETKTEYWVKTYIKGNGRFLEFRQQ